MTLKFYERLGHENRRPSPFSWRIRYALAHKEIEAEVIPVTFADVDQIRQISGQKFVPVAAFQWARLGCPRPIVRADDDVLNPWLARMIGLHDGLDDRFPGYPVAQHQP